MKQTFITATLAAFVLMSQPLHAQSQLRFKPGMSFTFPSPSGKGYAYKLTPGSQSSITLGGEYSHTLRNKKGSWHVGFTFHDGFIQPTPNEKNLIPQNLDQSSQFGFRVWAAPAKTVVYAGYEKFIGRNLAKPRKNYFSVVGGLGLAFTLNRLNWQTTIPEKYLTHNGGTIEGYTSNITKNAFPVAPCVYAGVRYNVNNKKGNTVLILELVGSYGFSSFYRETIDYTLDGAARRDVLKEKGFSVQLNVIVPLCSFGKKRK